MLGAVGGGMGEAGTRGRRLLRLRGARKHAARRRAADKSSTVHPAHPGRIVAAGNQSGKPCVSRAMKNILIALTALGLGACGQPVYRQVETPLPVASIDIDRYLGLWHEAARLPNSFERDCVDVTAEYARREDGLISVLNTCRESDGSVRDAEGRARFAGAETEGKLKVSFFGPFWGDYWVVERADDYAWAIVSEPGGRFLWVLTRDDELTAEERAFFQTRVEALGFRPGDLIWAS